VDALEAKRIVVGIDGSPSSSEALEWAVAEARLTGATIDAVYAWDPAPIETSGLPEQEIGVLREAAQERAAKIVRKLGGRGTDVRIVPRTMFGTAAQVLVDASEEADLLVVGSRGFGGLKGMVLGSVSHHCAAHARCPVVIVHRAPLRTRTTPARETLHRAPIGASG
jgi:nucleotide-binding universal stress UspA family protein